MLPFSLGRHARTGEFRTFLSALVLPAGLNQARPRFQSSRLRSPGRGRQPRAETRSSEPCGRVTASGLVNVRSIPSQEREQARKPGVPYGRKYRNPSAQQEMGRRVRGMKVL
jgi:hypothetical protein